MYRNPELVTFEEIDIDDELVTSQTGYHRSELVGDVRPISDDTKAAIVRLKIPDKYIEVDILN